MAVWCGLELSRSSTSFQLTGLGDEASSLIVKFLNNPRGASPSLASKMRDDHDRVYIVVPIKACCAPSPLSHFQERFYV